ncbi:hypothetical protein [Amycolatopsis sp. lyj-23]|uniref:hypothetical protein n=1 Tax=Amycolatopsis sp. lyj-23 TaxID=2789283 RepID=UPI00397E2336
MTESDARVPTVLGEEWPLDTAKACAAAMVDRAKGAGRLDDGEASEMHELLAAAGDVYAVHDLVAGKKATTTELCYYPGCFHARRAAGATGKPPKYCDMVRDNRGEDGHTPVRSFRRRKELTSGGRATAEEREAASLKPLTPVSDARVALPVRAAHVEKVVADGVADILDGLEQLRRQVATIGDDESRDAEIETIREEEKRKTGEANTARLAAEKAARQTAAEADEARRVRDEALEAAEDAVARTQEVEEAAAAERAQHQQALEQLAARHQAELAEVRQQAEDEITAIRDAAEKTITEAKDQAQARIDTITAEKDGEIAEAQADAADARGRADQLEEDLQTTRDGAAADRGRLEAAQAELSRVLGELEALKQEQQADQQRHDQEQAALRADLTAERERATGLQRRLDDTARTHAAELEKLTGRAEQLQQKLDDAAAKHQARLDETVSRHGEEVTRLHEQHTADRDAWRTQNAEIQRAHAGQVETLQNALDQANQRIEALTAAAAATETTGGKTAGKGTPK